MEFSEEFDNLCDEGAEGLTQSQAYDFLCNIGQNPSGLDFYDFKQKKGKSDKDVFTLEELDELNKSLGDPEKKLREAFKVFDHDNDGYVSKEELRDMLKQTEIYESGLCCSSFARLPVVLPLQGYVSKEELREMLKQTEIYESGLCCSSFARLPVVLPLQGYVSKEELREMLKVTDIYESGLHSDKEFWESYWQETLNAGDTNGDGKLDIDELVKLLLEGGVTM